MSAIDFEQIDELSIMLRHSLHSALKGGFQRPAYQYEAGFKKLFQLLNNSFQHVETVEDKEHWDSEAEAAQVYYVAAVERGLIVVADYSELDVACANIMDKVDLHQGLLKYIANGTLSDFLTDNPMPVMSDYLAKVQPVEVTDDEKQIADIERLINVLRQRAGLGSSVVTDKLFQHVSQLIIDARNNIGVEYATRLEEASNIIGNLYEQVGEK